MGVKVSYRGSLADPARVDEMVREIQAFAEHMGWRTWSVPELVESGELDTDGLRGVSVQVAPGCEPVHFHVDDQGRFVNHTYYALMHDAKKRRWMFAALRSNAAVLRGEAEPITFEELDRLSEEEDDDSASGLPFVEEGVGYNWTKTQFGGPAAHVQVCTLLRFVRDRFAPDLEVEDDTGYFEHGRLEEVTSEMALVDQTLRLVAGAVDRVSQEGSVSSLQELLDRLQRYVDEARVRN